MIDTHYKYYITVLSSYLPVVVLLRSLIPLSRLRFLSIRLSIAGGLSGCLSVSLIDSSTLSRSRIEAALPDGGVPVGAGRAVRLVPSAARPGRVLRGRSDDGLRREAVR